MPMTIAKATTVAAGFIVGWGAYTKPGFFQQAAASVVPHGITAAVCDAAAQNNLRTMYKTMALDLPAEPQTIKTYQDNGSPCTITIAHDWLTLAR